ncbi:hypothetical protein Tco_0393264 [Tanacetum coccineum]
MDEQTVRGWLNGLQDRFDTLFETSPQQRAAFFQQQHDAFEALFGNENNQTVDTIAGDQEDPDVKDKQENQDEPNIAISDQVLEESPLHTSDKVEAMPTSMVTTYDVHRFMDNEGIYNFVQLNKMYLQNMMTGRSYQGVGGSPEEASLELMWYSHTPLAVDVERRKFLKCYVQGSGRRKKTNGVDGGSGRQD